MIAAWIVVVAARIRSLAAAGKPTDLAEPAPPINDRVGAERAGTG